MTEHPIPFVAPLVERPALGVLVAAGNTPRVAFGGVHLRTPRLEAHLDLGLAVGAVNRSAPEWFAVRSHHSSSRSKLAFTHAYHVTTG